MILTQIELDQIKAQVRYDPESGEFFYLQDRYVKRRHQAEMLVPRPLKKVQSAGDRADKMYAQTYVGVYVLGRVINAAHLALYFITGHWPDSVKFKNNVRDDLMASNLVPVTRSQQTTAAAQARYEGQERKFPPNIYVCSNGQFIARKGDKRTLQFDSVREAIQAMEKGRWL